MIRGVATLQLVVLVAICVFAGLRKRREGRFIYLDSCAVIILFTLDIAVFAFYGNSLAGDEAKQWGGCFPDGSHVLACVFIGLLYAFVIGPITELARILIERDKKKSEDGKPGA